LVVRYYSRMRLNRVYPLSVEVAAPQGGAGDASIPVTVRPLVPGAIVVPPEQKLDPGQPGARAGFYVTALAKGSLRGALVEIFQPGQVVQTIPLRMKGTTQLMTLILALLTILIPVGLGLLVWYPMKGDVLLRWIGKPDERPNAQQPPNDQRPGNAGAPQGQEQGKNVDADPNKDRELAPVPKAVNDDEARARAEAATALLVLFQPDEVQGDNRGGGGQGGFRGGMRGGMQGGMRGGMQGGMRGGMQGGMPAPGQPRTKAEDDEDVETVGRPGEPDEVLRDRLRTWIRSRLPEKPPEICNVLATESCGRKFYKDSNAEEGDFAGWVGWSYKWVRALTADGWWLYVGLVFAGLTFCSWLMHGGARGSRRQVVMLGSRPADNATETLPLTMRDEPPTLEPVD
jgi:hypothetical protein